MSNVSTFLIEFNRRTRERRVTPYVGDGASRDVISRRVALEATRDDTDVEIVVLTSHSLETLAQTHARYFTGRDISGLATG